MAWAKLDDGFDTHRKVDRVSLEAVGLWARALAYASRYLTDGKVDHEWLESRVPPKDRREKLLNSLVDAGLFDLREDGIWIHDYLDYNPSKESVEERRERDRKKKEAQRKGTERRLSPRDTPGDGLRDALGDSPYSRPVPSPDPSSPAPTRPLEQRVDFGSNGAGRVAGEVP